MKEEEAEEFAEKVKIALLGAVIGAILTALIGFGLGGWVTKGAAEKMAVAASEKAMVAVLAPVCAEKFLAQPKAAAKKAALARLTKDQKRKGLPKEWTTLPDQLAQNPSLVKECTKLVLQSKK